MCQSAVPALEQVPLLRVGLVLALHYSPRCSLALDDEYRRRAGLLPADEARVDGALGAPGAGPAVDGVAHAVRGPEEAGAVPTATPDIQEMEER